MDTSGHTVHFEQKGTVCPGVSILPVNLCVSILLTIYGLHWAVPFI